MSEKILEALTRLFGIITKQDGGARKGERDFVVSYFRQELDQDSVEAYTKLYDDVSNYPNPGFDKIKMREMVRILRYCRDINKELAQPQKIIILVKLLELVASDGNFTDQRKEIISTVSDAFNLKSDYKLIESFVIKPTASIPELNSPNILVVSSSDKLTNPEAKHILSEKLQGEIMILRISLEEGDATYFVKYTGAEDVKLNGFTMKTNQVYLYSTGSNIKTPFGTTLYYSDVQGKFLQTLQDTKLSFTAKNLEFRFPNGTIGVQDITISEPQGKLMGIMGGSGAGKTTLLNVLSGIEKPSKGHLYINGVDLHENKSEIEGVIGYIAQDDLLIEELTVYQNLYFNGKLCFKDLNKEELHKRVMDTLKSLGLDHIASLKVGSVLNKKISGGQRKRLNIALELIREPSVLFVDEPTSGLSSKDSENVIDLLKELTLKGKLIFVIIHQPSLDIYKMFDKMIIMDKGGYPIYYGNPIEAVSYFRRATNQVDNETANINPEEVFNIIEDEVVDEFGRYTGKRKINSKQWNIRYRDKFEPVPETEVVHEKPPASLNVPNIFKQSVIFTTRDFLAKISNTQYLLINLLEAPVLAFLLAYVIRFQNGPDGSYIFQHNDNVPGYVLICIIISLFMGLTVSAEEIIKDRKIQKREAFLNLSRFSYLSSKIIILFLLSAIQSFLFVLIGNSILEVHGELVNYWVVLFSASCFANVLGLNISSTFNSVITIYITIPILLIPQLILSGLIFHYDKMNADIADKGVVPFVADIMISRWAYEAIAVNQYKSNPFEVDYYDYEKTEKRYSYLSSLWGPTMEQIVYRIADNTEVEKKNDSINQKIQDDLELLKAEIEADKEFKAKYLKGVNLDKDLTPKGYNRKVADKIKVYLDSLMDVSNRKMIKVSREKETKEIEMEKDYENYKITEYRKKYFNDQLYRAVTIPAKPLEHILEYKGRLLRQKNAVYKDPTPTAWYDYRAHFYAPRKHFAGKYFDTYYFNIAVIWLLTFMMYITLYFNFFKKFLDSLGKLRLYFGFFGSLKSLFRKSKIQKKD
ncbi:ATP-binding cassette domain-containing protein [Microscilla marina]|uniref:ABC-2 type transporter family n=1 Tax=Microscilla marina ATCC 23134 TaxID=313606 RepID=A1ZJ46_MICM2|nr:ATP-binding cassette domain-containing protein [Microscilla marina]EAY29582.1 ABC-2 type transporter family [Microscilla marina ATCC 23134]